MAWIKTKTVAVAALILVLGAIAVVVKVSFFPSIKDSYFQLDYGQFQKVPDHLLVLRPTHFHNPRDGASFIASTTTKTGQYTLRMMGRHVSLEQVVAAAYQCNLSRIVPPLIKPNGVFDYLVTVPDQPQQHLQAAIKKKLGYVASWKERDTDVLLLKVQMPDPPGFQPSTAQSQDVSFKNGRYYFTHMRPETLVGFLESGFKQPVLDRTGLTNYYDFSVALNSRTRGKPDQADMEKVLNDLGLKLEPGNESMQMLVVEKSH
jgi:uncharacterized protein (TIGR03435 family)